MIPKEKSKELTSKQFSIIARSMKFKSLNKDKSTENIHRFKSIETISKMCAVIAKCWNMYRKNETATTVHIPIDKEFKIL